MNSVALIGRLTKDPEVRYISENQTAVATFSIAINRGKDKNGQDRGADFPRVTVFGRQAENCERYLAKGRLVGVQGHIQTGSYKDKDGKNVYTTDVIAERVEFLDFGDKAAQNGTQSATEGAPEGFRTVSDEDIPF